MLQGRVALAAALLVLLGGARALAGPQDSRPGDVRIAYGKRGTAVRAEPGGLARVVASLSSGTRVTVEEVRLPWMRVSAVVVAGQDPVSGWLRAWETVEPWQLQVFPVGSRPRNEAERSHGSRWGLERGYALVDQTERDTAAADPIDSMMFIMDGDLGRRGRDYLPPPRVPAGDVLNEGRGGPNSGEITEKLGSLLGKMGMGGKHGDDMEEVGKVVGALAGYAKQLNEKFSPAQEYHLGRAVAADALAKAGVDSNEARRRYVKRVGDAIVRLADRLPGTYRGYHFEVLDSSEVRVVAGAGGFVLLTRGAVEACASEDELAGLIAHGLAHVSLKHGERVLRQREAFKARLLASTEILEAVSDAHDPRVGPGLLAVSTEAIGGMVATAVSHGYGRQLEFEADAEASAILYDVLYDWTALRNFLVRLPPPAGAAANPPSATPADRAAYLDPVVATWGPYAPRAGGREARLARFREATGASAAQPR